MTIDIARMKETALLLAQGAIDNSAVSTGNEPPRFVEFRDRVERGDVLLVERSEIVTLRSHVANWQGHKTATEIADRILGGSA